MSGGLHNLRCSMNNDLWVTFFEYKDMCNTGKIEMFNFCRFFTPWQSQIVNFDLHKTSSKLFPQSNIIVSDLLNKNVTFSIWRH